MDVVIVAVVESLQCINLLLNTSILSGNYRLLNAFQQTILLLNRIE